MTTITRRQLQNAIEAGITAVAEYEDFTAEHARALRVVGGSMTLVVRGSYSRRCGDFDERLLCPAARAIPGVAGLELTWVTRFATRFDDATWDLIKAGPLGWDGGFVLHITEDDNEVEAA